VYAGNLPGRVGDHENTRCHNCGLTLIQRQGYFIEDYRVTSEGRCPSCQSAVPGRWARQFDGQIADRPFLPNRLVTILS